MAEGKARDGQAPPNSIEAEQAVLGAILLNAEAVEEVIGVIGTDPDFNFFSETHRMIYKSMMALYADGIPIDIMTLMKEMQRRHPKHTNVSYLGELTGAVPTSANVVYYAKIVGDLALLRNVIQKCTLACQMAHQEDDPQTILTKLEKEVFELVQAGRKVKMVHVREVIDATLAQFESQMSETGIVGLATGFAQMDQMLGGFIPGDFIVIGARPSTGKTAFAVNIARNMSFSKVPVAFFSLEMRKEQIVSRMVTSITGIPKDTLRTSNHDVTREKLRNATDIVKQAPFYVDGTSGYNPLEIRSALRRLVTKHKVRVAFIDYLQLLSPVTRSRNRNEDVAEISKLLKETAKDLDIAMVALGQLNRDGAGPDAGMANLRDSGAIEQDADVVMILKKSKKTTGHITAEIDKQRNGPTGSFEIDYDVSTQLMSDVGTWSYSRSSTYPARQKTFTDEDKQYKIVNLGGVSVQWDDEIQF